MHLTKDQKFWVPDKDYYSRWGAKYEQKQFDSVMEYVSNRKVALDCGGHVGIWTKRLSYMFDTVIAVSNIAVDHQVIFGKNSDGPATK